MYRNEGRKGRGKEEGDIIMPNIIMSREHACGGHNNEATWTAPVRAQSSDGHFGTSIIQHCHLSEAYRANRVHDRPRMRLLSFPFPLVLTLCCREDYIGRVRLLSFPFPFPLILALHCWTLQFIHDASRKQASPYIWFGLLEKSRTLGHFHFLLWYAPPARGPV